MLLAPRTLVCLGVVATFATALAGLAGCSRTPIRQGYSETPDDPTGCRKDADCRGSNACEIRKCEVGLCQTKSHVTCDDGDPCTSDTCNPQDGTCSFTWLTPDNDGDGFRAALPGKKHGTPGACGDDCDDTSPLAHPGAAEVCDGVDNDCNDVTDDNFMYYGMGMKGGLPDVIWLSSAARQGQSGGLTYDGQSFAMTVSEQYDNWQGVFHAVGADGTIRVEATPLTLPVGDAFSGPLVWTGATYGTAWEDRRTTSYDIYFNQLDVFGKKLHADLRATTTDGFTIDPSLIYSGTQWLLAYANEDQGNFTIFTQRISEKAELVGEPTAVSPLSIDARQPRLSENSTGIGLFYYSSTDERLVYLRLDGTLQASGDPIPLPFEKPADTTVRWNGDRYIVAWTPKPKDQDVPVANAVWAMSLDATGRTIEVPRVVTAGASIARSPTVVGLGDRFMLVWADDRYSPGSYELSVQMFANDLTPIDQQHQVTALGSDSIGPVGTLGGGALGIQFRSRIYGPWDAFFLAIQCLYVPGK
jgi:hypothetical protein